MATFSTEAQVRVKFQLPDSVLVPSDLVVTSLEDAHTELLRYLDPQFNSENPEERLVLGETLLAGAHLYRSLAGKDAFGQKTVSIGGQQLGHGDRYQALTSFAALLENSAWCHLEPYLVKRPRQIPLAATDTVPVLEL